MGKRGPLPKSRALKEQSGQLPLTKEHIGKITDFTPPDPPKELSTAEKKIWKKTVEDLRHLRILERIDWAVLAAYCCCYVRWRKAESELKKARRMVETGSMGGLVIHPLVTISRNERKDMVAYAIQLGMTPAARMRVQTSTPPPKGNPFDKIKGSKKKR